MSPQRPAEDLGFSYRIRKSGEIDIDHHGKLAATLRGAAAAKFLAKVEAGDFALGQQLMARLTGNYKRGNERAAASSRHGKAVALRER